MRLLKQFCIIFAVTCLGELLAHFIPLPIPAGIYGILLMLTGLLTKVIPYESVKDVGHFLVEIMPVLFIPAAVGLMESWELIAGIWWQALILIFVSTVLVMGITGRVTQFVANKKEQGMSGDGQGHGTFQAESRQSKAQAKGGQGFVGKPQSRGEVGRHA